MCKSEIFAEYLKIVANVTEISEEEILSNAKTSEVADARSILVNMLIEKGFYPSQISHYMNRSTAGIRYLIANFSNRKMNCKMIDHYMINVRKMFESNSKNIHKQPANN